MLIRIFVSAVAVMALSAGLYAQQEPQVQGFVHETSEASDYVAPSDPLVAEKLDM